MNENKVPVVRIQPSRWQPRDAVFDPERLWDLARSIKETGLINPIVVFPVQLADDDPQPWYELVAGERRTRAVVGLAWARLDEISEKEAVERLAKDGLAGLPDEARALLEAGRVSIAAQVDPGEDLARLHQVAVVENVERESLSPLEEARALQGLADAHDWSQRELAKRLGKSQSWVAQRLALLGLSDEAQAAVSTRVLTPTHARAIARVPQELQPAITEWATAAVSRDDSPATTRQVQARARDLAKFVDPDRWLPNGETVYEPYVRNRLALMRWAVERADLEQRSEQLLALARTGWQERNVLGMKPIKAVNVWMNEMLEALLAINRWSKAWAQFAEETGRTCATCWLGKVELEPQADLKVYCARWTDPDKMTCENYIGVDDPVVIPLGMELTRWFDKLELAYEQEPFAHVTFTPTYISGYERAAEAKAAQMAQVKEERATAHVREIAAFQAWQAQQPAEALEHFQAHACSDCVNHRPGEVACRFVTEPLSSGYGPMRPPEFGVLVTEDGLMLPRCEQFAYAHLPWILPTAGIRLSKHEQIMDWLHGMITGKGGSNRDRTLFGVLRWLDYGRPLERPTDVDKLKRWILAQWDELGGDGAVAHLLDVALSEVRARGQYGSGKTLTLLSAGTHRLEEFAPVDFRYVTGQLEPRQYFRWPKGWPRPWEINTDEEIDHQP